MSFLEKYLTSVENEKKRYSLSSINDEGNLILTVADDKYKNMEEIKENIKLTVYAELCNEEDLPSMSFDRKEIDIDAKDTYLVIVEYMQDCLKKLNIVYNERSFDFSF